MNQGCCLALALVFSMELQAAAPPEANPGDWRASPYQFKPGAGSAEGSLRIRNLDSFPKSCYLQIALAGDDKAPFLFNGRVFFKADRSIEFPLRLPGAATFDDLSLNMGCLSTEATADTQEGQKPRPDVCGVQAESCDQLCPADSLNADACTNDHRFILFDRGSLGSREEGEKIEYSMKFFNSSAQVLSCQFLTAVKGIHTATGDVVYVQLSTEPQVIAAFASVTSRWTVSRTELAHSDKVDMSHPKIVATCTPGIVSLPSDYYTNCHPMKRPECNWALAR